MSTQSALRVAIVCDWLTGIGGAERVVLELHKLYPEAPIYTSQYDPSKIDWFKDADVRTTWLQKLPTSLKKFLPLLRAWTFSRLDLSDYDLVLSSSGAEAKAVKTGPQTLHICYCHAPTQYYWIRTNEYLESPGFPLGFNWLARLGLKLFINPLRRWDKRAAKRPDLMMTNVNDNEIVGHFESTIGFIMPNMDDFGIVAVEAMAAGTPVIAYNRGGALDYVIPGNTGLFFEKQTTESLIAALEAAMAKSFNHQRIAAHAAQFSVAEFSKNMRQFIQSSLDESERK
jgi:hypothetical protein